MRVVGLGNIPERGQNYIPSFPARPPGTKVPVQNFGCRGFPVGFYIPDIREFSRPTKGACIAPYSLYLGRGTGPQHRSATIVPALEFAIAAMFSSNLLLIRRLYPHVYRKVGSRNRIDITHNSWKPMYGAFSALRISSSLHKVIHLHQSYATVFVLCVKMRLSS